MITASYLLLGLVLNIEMAESFFNDREPRQCNGLVPSQVMLRTVQRSTTTTTRQSVALKPEHTDEKITGSDTSHRFSSNRPNRRIKQQQRMVSDCSDTPKANISANQFHKGKHNKNLERRTHGNSTNATTVLTSFASVKNSSTESITLPIEKRSLHQERNHSHHMMSVRNQLDDQRQRQGGSKEMRRNKAGSVPNVYWGAIPMDHLRQHPLFLPLPLPMEIGHLDCMEDVRYFRQDSWQWSVIHRGRCTTSQLASALGLLNPQSASFLGVPRSMQSSMGGLSAYHRLSEHPLQTLSEMNAVLCNVSDHGPHHRIINGPDQDVTWALPDSQPDHSPPFYAMYKGSSTFTDDKRHHLKSLSRTRMLSEKSVRMMWGNTQEATALLTALNYFARKEPGVVMKEIGMCGAGLDWNTIEPFETQLSPLTIGASPDALLFHPDGRVEVVEVKNHCPFIVRRSPRHVHNTKSLFAVRRCPMIADQCRTVMAHYLPQLMMEMLCVGRECRSAVMVRQTATDGAVILRLHRNDDWIKEMFFWLKRFYHDFVLQRVPPHAKFFWSKEEVGGDKDEDVERYKMFLQWTKDLSEGVDVLDVIPNNLVQRASDASVSMFLN